MFHKDTPMNVSLGKAALLIWMVFTTLYFLLSITVPMLTGKVQADLIARAQLQGYKQGGSDAMQSFSWNVFQNGYVSAVGQLVDGLGKQITDGCKEALPVQIGTGSVGIYSVPCINKLQEAAKSQTGSAAGQK